MGTVHVKNRVYETIVVSFNLHPNICEEIISLLVKSMNLILNNIEEPCWGETIFSKLGEASSPHVHINVANLKENLSLVFCKTSWLGNNLSTTNQSFALKMSFIMQL